MKEIVFVDRVSNKPFVASFETKDGWHKVSRIYTLHKMTSGEVQIGQSIELPNRELEAQALNAVFLQQTKGDL